MLAMLQVNTVESDMTRFSSIYTVAECEFFKKLVSIVLVGVYMYGIKCVHEINRNTSHLLGHESISDAF